MIKCRPGTLSIGSGAMSKGNRPVVCLDTSIFISFLKGDDSYSMLCRDVLREAQNGLFSAITSTLSIVETVHLAKPDVANEEVENSIKALYEVPWLTMWQLNKAVAYESSRLSRKYRGTTKDTPHDSVFVATAKLAGASRVFTTDQRFIRRFADNTEGVIITSPTLFNRQLNLPLDEC